jgi:transcriptional regulator of acetoin/glycerol metabolism
VSIKSETGQLRRLADIEREVLRLAMVCCEGRVSEVSRQLGIGRSTLYRKIFDRGLKPK